MQNFAKTPIFPLGAVVGLASFLVVGGGLPARASGPFAPQFLVDVWTSDRGLPQNAVTSLAQTPDGYLWVGTRQAGLARFDGVRFVQFKPANTQELPQLEISKLTVDAQGVLWISMVAGNFASYEAGRFKLWSSLPISRTRKEIAGDILISSTNELIISTFGGSLIHGVLSPGSNPVWTRINLPARPPPHLRHYAVSKDGRIWYLRADGKLGCWYDGALEPTQNYQGLKAESVGALADDFAGRVWVGTTTGIAFWDNGRFVDMTPTNGATVNNVESLTIAADGSQWIRTPNRLRHCANRRWISEVKEWPVSILPGEAGQTQIYADRRGGLWVIHSLGHDGTWYIQADGAVQHLTTANGLPLGQINCWLQDRENNVWLGFEGGGLAQLRPRYFETLYPPASAPGGVVRSVCEDREDGIWLGCDDGKIFRYFDGNFARITLPRGNAPVAEVTLWPDQRGNIWAGTVQNGVYLWRDGRSTLPFPANAIGTVVRVLFEDLQGQMWIGNEFGLYRWRNGALKKINPDDGFDGGSVLALAEDAGGTMWIGLSDGELWRCKAGHFDKFTLPPTAPHSRFWSLLPEPDGTVWVGTLDGGLLRWRDGKLSRCTTENGLPCDTISQLLDDGHGRLWAGSRAGIFSISQAGLNAFFDGHSKQVYCRTFNLSDGLPALECSGGFQPSCWRSHNGRLWFATLKGAVSVQPDAIPKNSLPPSVVIEEMRVDGVLQNTADDRRESIPPGRHLVEFRFTGLNLTAPERVRFQWQLSGLDTGWIDGGGQRTVSYNYVPAGSYAFRVRACNEDGVWNERGAGLKFSVLPHLWETLWFRLGAATLLLLFISAAISITIRHRYRLKVERIEQQHALERERARIAHDLHDDLGASLTQVAWLGAEASREDASAEKRKAILSKITDKSRDMVRAIDEIVWAVNPKNDSLDHLVSYICEFAEQMFNGTATRCRMDVPASLPPYLLSSDIRHGVYLIAKEALHNAAKHAMASHLWVRVNLESDALILSIEDDGRGFATSSPLRGDGFENMHQRAKALGVDFKLESTPGQGTIATLKLPLALTKSTANKPVETNEFYDDSND